MGVQDKAARKAWDKRIMGAALACAPKGRFGSDDEKDAEFKRQWVFPVDVELEKALDEVDDAEEARDLPRYKRALRALVKVYESDTWTFPR
jgi:hypothetical protein